MDERIKLKRRQQWVEMKLTLLIKLTSKLTQNFRKLFKVETPDTISNSSHR